MNETAESTLKFEGLPARLAIAGAVVVGVCIAAGLANNSEFFRSYLIAFLFWIGVTLGSLALLMIQHLTGGRWALVIRRILEASTRTLPLMAVAALPLLAGMKTIYAWANPGQTDPVIVAKHFYLNPGFFTARMIFYFAVWFTLAYFLNKWSRQEDGGGADMALWMRMEGLSGIGLVIFGFTVTFASIDWVMSLEPQWYSTIYGLLFMVSQALTALAFSITMLIWLSDRRPLSQFVRPAQFQDLGSFLLAFVMLWAYLEFSQFLIIWGGNLSDEIPWYIRRMEGVWGHVGMLLIILSFMFPFFLLLFRHVKRRTRSLLIVASIVLLMRLVDMFWMVLPAFGGGNVRLNWMDVALPLGMGGIWFAFFLWQLQRMPILPVHDPRMEEIAEQAAQHG
ncbi:MAG TPA: hypothetical protein VH161_02265 [Candidatus Acidoferrales bacterium]|jgi:hypothetical protein|nr:hypothetical protein [Candidatus Acidoferrales bacterium]